MFIRNGQLFNINEAHTLDGTQYPAVWFADPERRANLGVIEVADMAPPAITSTQRLVADGAEQDAEGVWVARWLVVDKTAEDLAAEAAALQLQTAAAIAATYRDVDAVYSDAIGQRGPEYADAETDARAFIAGGELTAYVSDFAQDNPTGQAQSNQWAAENIIARADAFRSAKLAMRSARFARQTEMRAATTTAALQLAISSWEGFIAGVRAQLGL